MEELEKRIAKSEELLLWNKDVLTFKEASTFLDLANSYLYKLVHLQKIPHYKPNGKKLYFDKEELVSWMKQGKSGQNSHKELILLNESGEESELKIVANNKGETVFSVQQ